MLCDVRRISAAAAAAAAATAAAGADCSLCSTRQLAHVSSASRGNAVASGHAQQSLETFHSNAPKHGKDLICKSSVLLYVCLSMYPDSRLKRYGGPDLFWDFEFA